ncbi:hypothetical protein PSPO01_16172 [Paraphaeosphaeria sporulosa]
MTTLLSTFPLQQPLQFVPYGGPPKQIPRRLPTKNKALSGDDARENEEEPAQSAHGAEVVDLTCSSYSEAKYKISGGGRESNEFGSRLDRCHQITNSRIDGASDDETSDDGDRAYGGDWSGFCEREDDWSLPRRDESVNFEQNGHAVEIQFGTLETLSQDDTAECGSQDIPSSLDDHQVHPIADGIEQGACPSQWADPSAQNMTGDLAPMLDKSEVIDLTDLGDDSSDDDEGERERKCPSSGSRSSSVLQDASRSARPADTQSPTLSPSSGIIQSGDAVPHGDLSFMANAGISSSDQLLQKASIHAIQDSVVEPWKQSQRSEPTSDQGEYSPLRGVNNGGDNQCHSNNNGDDRRDQRMSIPRLAQKRKRDASFDAIGHKRHSRTSSRKSKQRPTKAAHAPKQLPQYLSQHRPQPTLKVRPCAYDEVQCTEESGAESCSDMARKNENKSCANSKELQSSDQLLLNRASASDSTEYEVERILAVCLRRGNLKYQVQWVGYEADPEWYNASNFKNSPLKLRGFHEANPAAPGPPRRLGHWERCCEEDRDADDFSDDNEPIKSARGGRRAFRSRRAAI